MYTLIGKVDRTSYVPHDSINIATVAGDPVGKTTFRVVDPSAALSILALQEVIFIDETVAIGGTTLTPTHNYLNNNNFNFGSTGWTSIGSLSGRITYPSSGTFGAGALATLTFSNQAVGTAQAAQSVGALGPSAIQYVVVGQAYCFSATVNVTSGFSNAYAMLEIDFLDQNGATLSSTQSAHVTSPGSQRLSVQATAPVGTVTLQVAFGGATTTTTNSGTAKFTSLQLEPVWFPLLYSYPTPICDLLQIDSIPLPDSTTSRLDRIFTGTVSHMTVSYEGTTRLWDIEVTSADGMLENLTLVSAAYTAQTDQAIITNVISSIPPFDIVTPPLAANTPSFATSTPQALSYRNVPIIYAGALIDSIQYADATIREIIDSLSDMTGFLFGVDAYYNIFYYPPFYNAAPYAFSSSPDNVTSFAYYDYSIEYDASQIQTVLHITGKATTPLVYVQCTSPSNTAVYGRRFWSKINDTNLGSNAAAAARGEAQLQAYAAPRVTLKFKTIKLVSPGQTLDFTSALDALTDAHFTVQKVTATYLGNGINQYEVEAGTYVDDFVDFFRNTQKAVNRVSFDPTTTFLQQANTLGVDGVSYTDSLNIHV